jgi:large subunit ribosomal protein L17
MRHHNKNRKFGRKANARRALMRGLAVSLIRDEKITTTEAKAKSLRPYVEKLITKARKNDLAARRLITSKLGQQPETAKKLVEEIAPRFDGRPGGYTRITKLMPRQGDASPMAVIEFVQ